MIHLIVLIALLYCIIVFIVVLEMVKIGVTGSICSGKSSFCKLLESTYVCVHIDADKIGHECYLPNTTCYYKLIDTFTDIIIDKETNEIDHSYIVSMLHSQHVTN